MRKISLTLLLFLLVAAGSGAQQKYWIYLKDKKECSNTGAALCKDFYDLPVSTMYKDSLKKLGYETIQQSRWLNAVTVLLEGAQQKALKRLNFVKKIAPVNQQLKVLSYKSKDVDFGPGLYQVNADTLIHLGLHGHGVKIGIIDAGFLKADKEEALHPLVRNEQLVSYRNFIEKKIDDPFFESHKYNDDHGTKVWKLIGGYNKSKNKHHGLANAATYYLARTDQGDKEYRGEEDHWIAALEWMYDQGVRLINSSLGYSDGYDDPAENYMPEHADGSSSAITRAAAIAAKEKGMILVISAGNDGNNAFEVISVPADAEGIITVGATGYNRWSKQSYSSIGPAGLPYVKPEVACYSSRGTSFSAPVITGLIAGLLQAYPTLTNTEIALLLKKSGHLYPYPNNYIGYGVPDARKMIKLLAHPFEAAGADLQAPVRVAGHFLKLNLSTANVVLFHKRDEKQVIDQEFVKPRRGMLDVRRMKGAKFTTVATPEKVFEIEWVD